MNSDWLITFQHGLLVFGCADESTYALDHLTLRLRLLILGLFRQKHHWTQRQSVWCLFNNTVHFINWLSLNELLYCVSVSYPSYSSLWWQQSWTWSADCVVSAPAPVGGGYNCSERKVHLSVCFGRGVSLLHFFLPLWWSNPVINWRPMSSPWPPPGETEPQRQGEESRRLQRSQTTSRVLFVPGHVHRRIRGRAL